MKEEKFIKVRALGRGFYGVGKAARRIRKGEVFEMAESHYAYKDASGKPRTCAWVKPAEESAPLGVQKEAKKDSEPATLSEIQKKGVK